MRTSRRKLAWIAILLVCGAVYFIGNHPVSTGPAEGSAFAGPTKIQSTGRYLRVGTFNIDGGQGTDGKVDLERTAKCIQHLDFVGMNEVHGYLIGSTPNQAYELCLLLHLPYLYVPAEKQWGRDTFGNAVFSNLPISRWQRVVLPSLAFHAKRNYLLTDAMWHGTIIHFITTHTDWKPCGAEQFEIVRNLFLNSPTPVVLMGDLNTPASNPLIGDLEKTPGVEEAIGKVLEKIPGRVDWIFLRGLKTVDAGQVNIGASDHPAYWASVRLEDPSLQLKVPHGTK